MGASRKTARFSFRRMAACGVVLALLFLLVVSATAVAMAVRDMKHEADLSLAAAQPRIESRITGTFNLLESLAEQPTLYDPSVPIMDKVNMIDQVNEHFGYYLICYVDMNIDVWDATGPASLASRDYMQQIYSTGERTVTDSFAAGADGSTLNYTVVVPLRDEQGAMTGTLFAAVYFDEIVDMLNDGLANSYVDSVLIGSKGQVMSATSGYVYDDFFLDPIRQNIAFDMSADVIEAELLSMNPVSFWTVDGLDVRYYAAAPIADTKWDAVCVVGFWDSYAKIMANLLPMIVVGLVILAGGFLLMYRNFLHQMNSARMLEKSVEELQKKVYSDERPAGAEIEDILELTSSGLSDGLTGTVTRSVFSSRLENVLENADDEEIYALCFVDLDDFKAINDTHGHATGDIALKSIGYLLREYERRYEGLVGRYGGDEFVLLMTDFDDENELRDVLEDLTAGLQVDVQSGDSVFSVGCSVGVSVWDHRVGADEPMEQADQALYGVKQRGKHGYGVYQDGGKK
ncbi:diguanylate cyclase domain-containing protein [Gordonibacter massiliensis (ex Traore et al. 2017)]|uniref:GGDEF domain-containing protein n=1 Tax=Gordonibacter massiliensis (ex Traore et al. 2017) TaxID=1841863 RepID=A0A842JDY4_9ACTN|nr:diguanylate cyclase [Gordonibacter massiliensis (ex Traore et al. 2017)]MBC2889634.1 GGDEF domain-containing protein [Gordonibacter massiliensis (ex Traore et al. 2017)]